MIAKLIAKYLIGEKENLPLFLGQSSITAYTPSTCVPLILKNSTPPPPQISPPCTEYWYLGWARAASSLIRSSSRAVSVSVSWSQGSRSSADSRPRTRYSGGWQGWSWGRGEVRIGRTGTGVCQYVPCLYHDSAISSQLRHHYLLFYFISMRALFILRLRKTITTAISLPIFTS